MFSLLVVAFFIACDHEPSVIKEDLSELVSEPTGEAANWWRIVSTLESYQWTTYDEFKEYFVFGKEIRLEEDRRLLIWSMYGIGAELNFLLLSWNEEQSTWELEASDYYTNDCMIEAEDVYWDAVTQWLAAVYRGV